MAELTRNDTIAPTTCTHCGGTNPDGEGLLYTVIGLCDKCYVDNGVGVKTIEGLQFEEP